MRLESINITNEHLEHAQKIAEVGHADLSSTLDPEISDIVVGIAASIAETPSEELLNFAHTNGYRSELDQLAGKRATLRKKGINSRYIDLVTENSFRGNLASSIARNVVTEGLFSEGSKQNDTHRTIAIAEDLARNIALDLRRSNSKSDNSGRHPSNLP
jgi:hypothetical protein